MWGNHFYKPECAHCAWYLSDPDAVTLLLFLKASFEDLLLDSVSQMCSMGEKVL